MKWRPMTDSPSKSGRYIVKHRGQIGGHAWYTAKVGDTHYPVGWEQIPEFGPTHWLDETRSKEIPLDDDSKRFWPIEKKRKTKCTHCNGKGSMWWQLGKLCSKCGGSKWVYVSA